jgi:acetyl-CoA acetyltransferase family protein
MTTAVIVDAVRTAIGARNGRLSGWHPTDLAAEVLGALALRNDLDPALVDDVVLGCVTQYGDQAMNVARNAVLAAGWPDSVPGVTVDRQCASSQQAVHFAAQAVIAGVCDVVVAGGVECTSSTPLGTSVTLGTRPFGPRVIERYAADGGLVPQGVAAEHIAERWSLGRQDLDAYAAASLQRGAQATREGRFRGEIVPVQVRARDRETGQVAAFEDDLLVADEGGWAGAPSGLAELKPAFVPDGRVTAGNSAHVGDGAAGVLIMSEERASRLGLRPLARFCAFGTAASNPLVMLTGAIPATARALERAKLGIRDIDAFEVNEPFASVVLAWAAEHDADLARVNPNGGAIALGHPLGAAGARLLTTLAHELDRCGGRYGLQAMSAAGGVATALVVERLG